MERREFLRKSVLTALGTATAGSGLVQAFNHIGNNESKTGKMKITVLTGSPRANGNSAYLAEQFIKGAQEKGHEIYRFYAINGQIKGAPKKAAFLMTYADTAEKEAAPMLLHYRTLMDYLGWESVGEVVASGVWTTGSVRSTRYAEQAYQLGKSI